MLELIILVGIPKSGKTKLVKDSNLDNCVSLNYENHKLAKEHLLNGRNVIIDDTNLTIKERSKILDSVRGVNCYKRCIIVVRPILKCVQYAEDSNVIHNSISNFQVPFHDEGFDNIQIIRMGSKPKKLIGLFLDMSKIIKISSKHNGEDLFSHGMLTLKKIKLIFGKNKRIPQELIIASFFHDIGRVFVDGDDMKYHQNHSAYAILSHYSVLSDDQFLRLIFLINYHEFLKIHHNKNKEMYDLIKNNYEDLYALYLADID